MSTADRFIELRKRYIESQYSRLNKEQLQAALTEYAYGGREIPLARLCGATDSRHWKALGIPVPVLGVTGGNEHSAGEYVELDSIGRYADAIVKFADGLAAE